MNGPAYQGTRRDHLPGWLVITGSGDEEKTNKALDAGLDSFDDGYGSLKEITTSPGLGFGFRKPLDPLSLTTWSLCVAGGKTCFMEGIFYDDYLSHRPVQGEDRTLAEVFLRQFRKTGKKAIEQLNGSFSGFIFDHETGSLITFVDRLGVHVLYWSQEGGRVTVSSNLQAFRGLRTLELDDYAAFQFLTIGFPVDERTLLKDVMIQLPCTMAVYDGASRESIKYWDVPKRLEDISLEESVEMISRAVESHVSAIHERTQKKLCLGITGGHDSRVVLSALASRQLPFDPVLWKDGNFNDAVVTRLCSLLGRQPLVIPGATDEDRTDMQKGIFRYSDGTYMYAYGFARLARFCFERGVDHLLLGFSGDRISGGLTIPAPQYLRDRDELAACTLKGQAELLSFSDAQALLRSPERDLGDAAKAEWRRSFDRAGSHEYLADVSIWQGVANRNLKRVRFSMMPARQYLQPVFPYLDNKVLAAYMSMPIRYLHNQKAHCYAGFHRIKEFGNFRACSYPLSLKDEARFPSALHLARVSRQKTRDFFASLAPGRRKVRSVGVPGRMMDDLLQCPLFEKQVVNSLVREGRAGLRDIQKMHTLARFYDYFVLGNNAFSSEGA